MALAMTRSWSKSQTWNFFLPLTFAALAFLNCCESYKILPQESNVFANRWYSTFLLDVSYAFENTTETS